jgi:hypothetical protein
VSRGELALPTQKDSIESEPDLLVRNYEQVYHDQFGLLEFPLAARSMQPATTLVD